MSGGFSPEAVAEEFIFATLSADAGVAALLGAGDAAQVWPAPAPPHAGPLHVTTFFSGPSGGIPAVPLGRAVAQLGMRWLLTGWRAGYDKQAIVPVMEAVMVALIGADRKGRRFRWADRFGRGWAIGVTYLGPDVAPADIAPEGPWSRISETYLLDLRPVS